MAEYATLLQRYRENADPLAFNSDADVEAAYGAFMRNPTFGVEDDLKRLLILRWLRERFAPPEADDISSLGVGAKIGELEVIDIAQGGAGDFFVCFDTAERRVIGLKRLRPAADGKATSETRERAKRGSFLLECVRAMSIPSTLSPTLNGIRRVARDGRRGYLAYSDYVPGSPLLKQGEQPGNELRIDPAGLHRVLYDVVYALCGYSCGFVDSIIPKGSYHGDIHGENILIRFDGAPVVIDWGQSSIKRSRKKAYAAIAPELLRNDGVVGDGRVDVFSLGVLLFRILCGEYPYGGTYDDKGYVVRMDSYDVPLSGGDPRLKAVAEGFEPFIEILPAMLHPDPAERIGLEALAHRLKAMPFATRDPAYSVSQPTGRQQADEDRLRSLVDIMLFGEQDMAAFIATTGSELSPFDQCFELIGRLFFKISAASQVKAELHLAVAFFEGALEWCWSAFLRLIDREDLIPDGMRSSGTIEYSRQTAILEAYRDRLARGDFAPLTETGRNPNGAHVFVISGLIRDLATMAAGRGPVWRDACVSSFVASFPNHVFLSHVLEHIGNLFDSTLSELWKSRLVAGKPSRPALLRFLEAKPTKREKDGFELVFDQLSFLLALHIALTDELEERLPSPFWFSRMAYAALAASAADSSAKPELHILPGHDSPAATARAFRSALAGEAMKDTYNEGLRKVMLAKADLSIISHDMERPFLSAEDFDELIGEAADELATIGSPFDPLVFSRLVTTQLGLAERYEKAGRKGEAARRVYVFNAKFESALCVIERGISRLLAPTRIGEEGGLLLTLAFGYNAISPRAYLALAKRLPAVAADGERTLCSCLLFIRDQIFLPRFPGFRADGFLRASVARYPELLDRALSADEPYRGPCVNVLCQAAIDIAQSIALNILRGTDADLPDPLSLLAYTWERVVGSSTVAGSDPLGEGARERIRTDTEVSDIVSFAVRDLVSAMLSISALFKTGKPMRAEIAADARIRYARILAKAWREGNLRLYNQASENLASTLFFTGHEYAALAVLRVSDDYFSGGYSRFRAKSLWIDSMFEAIGHGGTFPDRFGGSSATVANLVKAGVDAKNAGSLAEAESLLARAISIDPYDPRSHNSLGNCVKKRDPATALACFDRAIGLMHGDYAEALYNKADCCERMGDLEGARQNLREVLKLDPNEVDALAFLRRIGKR